jgi:hypothetical protein
MTGDMKIRNLALTTQASYLQQVSLFARHFNKSPEILGREEIRTYQLYLAQEKKLSPSALIVGGGDLDDPVLLTQQGGQ